MRTKIELITCLHEGKPEEQYVKIHAYKMRFGLAAGHPVRLDSDGQAVYCAGWVIYHAASGMLVKCTGPNHKTPAAALNYCRQQVPGLLARLKTCKYQEPVCDCPAEVLGKLKTWPKPKLNMEKPRAGCERVDVRKFAGFLALIDEVDNARKCAFRTSEKQITFKISRSTFTVGASLDSLNKFRMRLLKNRAAFADKCFQVKPECAKVAESVKPECALTDNRKAELSVKAAEAVRNIMVKQSFNPAHIMGSAVSFAAIN